MSSITNYRLETLLSEFRAQQLNFFLHQNLDHPSTSEIIFCSFTPFFLTFPYIFILFLSLLFFSCWNLYNFPLISIDFPLIYWVYFLFNLLGSQCFFYKDCFQDSIFFHPFDIGVMTLYSNVAIWDRIIIFIID